MRRATLSTITASLVLAPVLLLTACGGGATTTSNGGVVASADGTVVSADPSGDVSFSSSEGSGSVGGSVPADFPSDVPQPSSLTVVSGIKLPQDGKDTWTVTYQSDSGDTGIGAAYVKELKSAGFTVDSEFTGDGSNGGIWQLSNPTWKVGVVSSSNNGKTALIVSVIPNDGCQADQVC